MTLNYFLQKSNCSKHICLKKSSFPMFMFCWFCLSRVREIFHFLIFISFEYLWNMWFVYNTSVLNFVKFFTMNDYVTLIKTFKWKSTFISTSACGWSQKSDCFGFVWLFFVKVGVLALGYFKMQLIYVIIRVKHF